MSSIPSNQQQVVDAQAPMVTISPLLAGRIQRYMAQNLLACMLPGTIREPYAYLYFFKYSEGNIVWMVELASVIHLHTSVENLSPPVKTYLTRIVMRAMDQVFDYAYGAGSANFVQGPVAGGIGGGRVIRRNSVS